MPRLLIAATDRPKPRNSPTGATVVGSPDGFLAAQDPLGREGQSITNCLTFTQISLTSSSMWGTSQALTRQSIRNRADLQIHQKNRSSLILILAVVESSHFGFTNQTSTHMDSRNRKNVTWNRDNILPSLSNPQHLEQLESGTVRGSCSHDATRHA